MTTLHKKLAEIRELQVEELDLVGGAGEGGLTLTPCGQTFSYVTGGDGQQHYNQDDACGDGATWDPSL